MPPGLDNLKHSVVLMMENRSFDHMLGGLKANNPAIDDLTLNESNLDTTGAAIKVQPLAEFQSQLDPDPDHQGKINRNGKGKGSGQECPLHTRENAREACASRALCCYFEIVFSDDPVAT